ALLRPPLWPFFPGATAHPTRHDENAEAVRLMPEAIVLVITLEANRVEMHVERIAQLGVLSLRLQTEEHVRRPAAAANQNSSTVDAEEATSFRCRLGSNFADAESQLLLIQHTTTAHEFERQRVELRLAELEWPPQTRVGETKLRKTVGRDSHQCTVVRPERHRLAEGDVSDPSTHRSRHGLRREIL